MRTIETHKVNGLNEAILIEALDAPGSGGANHEYRLSLIQSEGDRGFGKEVAALRFQNGPIAEVGPNGISNEALLAIVIDRLESFQSGPFACRENALALTKLQEAMHWLHHRTRARMARGVEGTHQK